MLSTLSGSLRRQGLREPGLIGVVHFSSISDWDTFRVAFTEAAPAFGAKLGVQVGTDISSKVSLTGLVGYRFVFPFREKETNMEVDGLNFSGLTIGGGVGYRF